MLDPTLQVALNNQYNFERYSEAVYLAFAGDLEYLNLTGMAAFMRKRAGEEHAHAAKFAEYITDRNEKLVVDGLPRPEGSSTWDVMTMGQALFNQALEHERLVTSRIEALYGLSCKLEDGRTCVFTHWFLTEQVEEERTLEEILTKFTLASGNGAAILLIDKDLGA